VKQDSKGVIISGNLALSTRPYRPEGRLQKVADIHEIVAMQGSLPAEMWNEFLADLRDSWGNFSWMPPHFVKLPSKVDEMRAVWRGEDDPDPETVSRLFSIVAEIISGNNDVAGMTHYCIRDILYRRRYILCGNGPGLSSFLSDEALGKIDVELNSLGGFDGLCASLRLPLSRKNPVSSFQISAELPASIKGAFLTRGHLCVVVICPVTPALSIEWWPIGERRESEKISAELIKELMECGSDEEDSEKAWAIPEWVRGKLVGIPIDLSNDGLGPDMKLLSFQMFVACDVPRAARGARLVISFGELEADAVRVDFHKLKSDSEMPPECSEFELMPEEPAVVDSGAGKVNISPKRLRLPGSITAENYVTPENPSASGSQPKASAQEKRPGPLFARSRLAQTIQELLLKKRDASAREICGLLDEQVKVRLPKEWKNDPNDRSFEDVYDSDKRIRTLIDRYISRVRTHIKAARL
jgi:hypothetical protein